MLVYKCDGESYSTGKKCENEVENELPTRWLSITGNIKNGLHDAHYIECNGGRHFCSRRCLENFLFKDVNPARGNGPLYTMTTDPNLQAGNPDNQEAIKEQAEANAQESASQDQAMGASEEGSTEG